VESIPSADAKPRADRVNDPLSNDEILELISHARAFPLDNVTQLRLLATAEELRRYRLALAKMREAAGSLGVT
jgi:hypothetical protein